MRGAKCFDGPQIIGPLKRVGLELHGAAVAIGCFLQQAMRLKNHAKPSACLCVLCVTARERICLVNLLVDFGSETIQSQSRQLGDRGMALSGESGGPKRETQREKQA